MAMKNWKEMNKNVKIVTGLGLGLGLIALGLPTLGLFEVPVWFAQTGAVGLIVAGLSELYRTAQKL